MSTKILFEYMEITLGEGSIDGLIEYNEKKEKKSDEKCSYNK